jgi:hypothetical protein
MAFTVNLKNARQIFGKTKARSQMCLVATEDGRLVPVEIPVKKGCAADDERVSAWLLDADNQFKDAATGNQFQIVGERSSIPICLLKQREQFKKKDDTTSVNNLQKLIEGVFHNSWVTDLILLNRKAEQDKHRSTAILVYGIPIIMAALIIAIKVIRG